MADFGWDIHLIGRAAAVFAGIPKGGFGSGAAFASATILALFGPAGVAPSRVFWRPSPAPG